MHEIKCRAKDYTGEWSYGAYIYDDVHKKHFIISCGAHGLTERAVDAETRGQFVMKHDDIEYYEGDILRWSDSAKFGFESVGYSGIYIIKWNDTDLRYALYDPFSSDWWELGDTNFDTLTGNIHDTPKLLNGANA